MRARLPNFGRRTGRDPGITPAVPAPEGAVFSLNGANIAYRRQVLMEHTDLMAQGYWEANLNPALIAKGMRKRRSR